MTDIYASTQAEVSAGCGLDDPMEEPFDDPPEYEPPEGDYERQLFEEALADYLDHDVTAPY